jgi:hypothetical protein
MRQRQDLVEWHRVEGRSKYAFTQQHTNPIVVVTCLLDLRRNRRTAQGLPRQRRQRRRRALGECACAPGRRTGLAWRAGVAAAAGDASHVAGCDAVAKSASLTPSRIGAKGRESGR